MRRGRRLAALAVIWALALGGLAVVPPAPVAAQARPGAAAAPEAGEFIVKLADRAIAGLTDANVAKPEREQRFRHLLNEGFDIAHIARFVLGRYWRMASETERAEYLRLFEDFVVDSYAQRFGEYAGENLKVTNTRAAADDAIVFSDLLRPNGPPVKVEWKLRREGSSFKIVDVIVEGVSMSITQRDDFSATIQRTGGKVEGLLSVLRDKLKTTSVN
jgi:phospholipid transport system substrate-binding protein